MVDLKIMENFLLQISVIKESLKIELEEFEIDPSDIVIAIIHNKFIEYYNKNEIKDKFNYGKDLEEKIKEIVEISIKKNKMFRKLNDLISVRESTENPTECELYIPNSAAEAFVHKILNNGKNDSECVFKKQDLTIRTAIIFICISFENLCAEILREQFKLGLMDSKLSDKSLTYNDLKMIKNIDDAKELLIEREIDSFFRDKFKVWFENLDKRLNIIKHFDINENLSRIDELFQRRNLYVHSNGVVNGIYVKSVEGTSYTTGDSIVTDIDYIENMIRSVVEVAWYVYFSYCCRIYKDETEEFFNGINELLLNNLKDGTVAIPTIYKMFEKDKKITQQLK